MRIKVDEETELRQLRPSDAGDIFEVIDKQRFYLGKWLPFVEFTKKVSDTEKFVEATVNVAKDRFEYVFTIRKQDAFVGLIGFKDTDRINSKTEIGYWLSEEYQGKGIVSKSVASLCEFAFNELGLNRIQIRCAVENRPSIKIPKRLGFRFEGIERQGELLTGNVFTDLEVYSKLKSDE
jgi:ribosomal-protein-serine acetyltransferase